MAEIQLNKPLYKDGGPPSGNSGSPGGVPQSPAPRPPRPALWMRGAAVAIDFLILHGVTLLVLQLAFDAMASLGVLGPYVGLAFGTLYFTVGSSFLTEGHTVGKLVMRMQTADGRNGGDLSLPRAFVRALLFIWPLWVYAAVQLRVEKIFDPLALSAAPMALNVAGSTIPAAWYLGNLFHAWVDPYGRTLVDRLAGSVVFSREARTEDLQDFLRGVRTADATQNRRGRNVFVASVTLIAGLAVALGLFFNNWFKSLSPEARETLLAYNSAHTVPGFAPPAQLPADRPEKAAADDTPTTSTPERGTTAAGDRRTTGPQGAQFQFWKRGRLTLEEVKTNPAAMAALDRMIAYHTKEHGENILSGKDPRPEEELPRSMILQVGFAQIADLFFASKAVNVYSAGQEVDLQRIRREARETSATATGTAPAAGDQQQTTGSAAP